MIVLLNCSKGVYNLHCIVMHSYVLTLGQQSQVMSDLCTDMLNLTISSNFIRLLNVVGEGNLTAIKIVIILF